MVTIYSAVNLFDTVKKDNLSWIEIKVPAWSRVQFTLPYGTTGWLNSNSSVSYDGNFNADRLVVLNGEAFFNVAKDKNRPFLVESNVVELQVTGTRFNIVSYENENNIEVVLEEGELVFKNEEMNKSYKMKPNDLVIYDKTRKDYTTEIVEPQKYLSFKHPSLKKLIMEMKIAFLNTQKDFEYYVKGIASELNNPLVVSCGEPESK